MVQKSGIHRFEVGSLSHDLQGFYTFQRSLALGFLLTKVHGLLRWYTGGTVWRLNDVKTELFKEMAMAKAIGYKVCVGVL